MKIRLLLLLPLLAACNKPEPPPQAPRPAVVITAGSEAASAFQIYSGEVRARHEMDLAFRIGGKLVARQVSLGNSVKRGQVLAQIDAQDAQLASSAARAQVAAAEAEVTLARSEYERAQTLLAQKFVSASVVDTRRAQLQAAESRLRQAQAQAGVQGNQIGYTALRAERDGVITAAPVEAGQVVAAGQTVLRMADPREREVLIWVPESRLSQVKIGQNALVRPWNAPDRTYPGSVREVAASADSGTRTYAVRVAVPQAGSELSLGSTAAVGFAAPAAKDEIVLPLSAVVRTGAGSGGAGSGNPRVWVVSADNVVQARAVDVARWGDETVRLRSGVRAGERVVAVGAHALSDGLRVQPVAQSVPVALDIRK